MVQNTHHSIPATTDSPSASRLLHDLRNTLAGLKLDVSLLADDISANEDSRARILAYTDDLQEAIRLTHRLTTELGQWSPSPAKMSSNEVLEGIAEMVERTLPFSCLVELELETEIWPVRVDASLLHRALVNLVTRSQGAMPSGGMLHLASSNRKISRAGAAGISPEMEPGSYVLLSVGTLGSNSFDDEPLGAETFDGNGPSSGSSPSNPSSIDEALVDSRAFWRVHHGPMMTTFELYLPAASDGAPDAALWCADATEQGRGPRRM